ncbi:HNH endonuclease [Acetivibrio cellulolyticus]|uniref:HNH endonuclease n=1 Tax=Acetivibrio cellulolyticus TaxID=35830 RepID=UPI0002481B62
MQCFLLYINIDAEKVIKNSQGLTWHHHQVTGRTQLVPTSIHRTGHLDGNAIWGGGIR